MNCEGYYLVVSVSVGAAGFTAIRRIVNPESNRARCPRSGDAGRPAPFSAGSRSCATILRLSATSSTQGTPIAARNSRNRRDGVNRRSARESTGRVFYATRNRTIVMRSSRVTTPETLYNSASSLAQWLTTMVISGEIFANT